MGKIIAVLMAAILLIRLIARGGLLELSGEDDAG